MNKGSKEIEHMFNELNRLINKAKNLRERVKRKWEEEFPPTFFSYDLKKLSEEIEFFQKKYDFDKKLKIDMDGVLRNISEKYQIKDRIIERNEKPGFWESALYVINEKKGPKPETKKYIMTETYGKFLSDPTEDFLSLLEGLLEIYHHYMKKHAYSPLDVVEYNYGNFLKGKFFKSKKLSIISTFIGIVGSFLYIAAAAFFGAWFYNLFN